MKLFHSVVLASCVVCAFAAPSKPHLVMVLQDDLGHYDTGITNPTNLNVTANITQLSREGIVLEQHYVRQENIGAPSRASQRLSFLQVYYWCSPTRRSFLSGRLPLHHGEQLSAYTSDNLDLRWNLISQKLESAGYHSYWFGKGHTG
jgi:arylsulfatase I/J